VFNDLVSYVWQYAADGAEVAYESLEAETYGETARYDHSDSHPELPCAEST
jgi:hypothetical protein